MSLRLIVSSQSTNVVPMRPAKQLTAAGDEQPLKPDQPRDLMVVAVLLHQLTADSQCESCRREVV